MNTLADITAATGFEVLEHLEAQAEIPVLDGLQAQGDLLIIPAGRGDDPAGPEITPAGVAVIAPIGGGHEHRLFASAPATAWWAPGGDGSGGQDIGVLTCTEPVYSLHAEHGAAGIAPGTYVLRRQREQADEERLVAD